MRNYGINWIQIFLACRFFWFFWLVEEIFHTTGGSWNPKKAIAISGPWGTAPMTMMTMMINHGILAYFGLCSDKHSNIKSSWETLRVGGLEHGFYFPFHIWDNPCLWLIFFEMVKTTNQLGNTANGTIMCCLSRPCRAFCPELPCFMGNPINQPERRDHRPCGSEFGQPAWPQEGAWYDSA